MQEVERLLGLVIWLVFLHVELLLLLFMELIILKVNLKNFIIALC